MGAGVVPGSFDELTIEWLRAALAADGSLGATPATVTVEPLGVDVGLLGDLARLHVTWEPGATAEAPSTMIVKLPAADPGGRQVATMLNAYAREIAFYRDVAPVSAGARVPACYHAAADPEADRWVLILEDCAGDETDHGAGATVAQAEAAVDALAAFHAAWWQSSTQFEWMPGFDTVGVSGLQQPWLAALPIFVDRFRHVIPAETVTWPMRFALRLPEWSDQVGTQPLTIVHTDYRLDNLLFTSDGAADGSPQVTMIDWQTALRGPGAMDLTCFLATSLSVADRRAHETALIDRYLGALHAAGISIDRQWFEQSFDENLLWWMCQFGNNLSRLEPDDPATQAALDTMIERTYTAGLDRNVGRLLG